MEFCCPLLHQGVPQLFLLSLLLLVVGNAAAAPNFNTDFAITWAPENVQISEDGQQMVLSLNNKSGSGFASVNQYIFGSIDMQIKLVPGNSAGTVTAYYFTSDGKKHDELDFEFLGNVSGQPYILQTNVFASGVGEREQRIFLWFDPTLDFHTYSILWNPQQIVFSVDGTPIRVFPNNEVLGVPYLKSQPMGIFSSIWNGDSWATMGGLVKIDWKAAPFTATYGKYTLEACESKGEDTAASCAEGSWWNSVNYQTMAEEDQQKLKWVQDNYIIYDYCTDVKRYPKPPVECIHQFATPLTTSSSRASSPSLSPSNTTMVTPNNSTSSISPSSASDGKDSSSPSSFAINPYLATIAFAIATIFSSL